MELSLRRCGYKEPRPYQKQILEGIWRNKDCLLCAPTGYGKSLVFEVASFLLHNRDSNITTADNSYEN